MPMNAATTRLTQTFKFLKELNELRNPVPREISGYAKLLWINEWPTHPFIEVRRGDRKEEDDGTGEVELEPMIRIRRAGLTPCPKPPDALDGWLKTRLAICRSRCGSARVAQLPGRGDWQHHRCV